MLKIKISNYKILGINDKKQGIINNVKIIAFIVSINSYFCIKQ